MLLFGACLAVGQAPATATREIEADLSDEFNAAVKAFMEEYRAADEKARPALLADPVREPRHRFTPLFLAEAEKRKGTPAALADWAWLVENGSIVDVQVGDEAAGRLLTDHLSSADLGPGAKAIGRAAGVRGVEKTIAELTRILDGSPHQSVRAEAFFQRGLLRRQAAPSEARQDFQSAVSLAPDSAPGKKAAAELQATAPPAVGNRAPRLEGKTLAGDTVKLADLSGRVVLIDFWGAWCGPCVAEMPKLKKLQARFAKKPFALLGVNSDKDPETLRRFLARSQIGWTNILDGGTEGPVHKAWGVDAWPSSFLVDASGVIRGQGLSFDELEKKIAEMLTAH
jgi:thiol-disulfide isomerase/thioredoxin